jgi:Uma2 family endonuclease
MAAKVKQTAASPAQPAKRYSMEEYLALEVESTERHEYRDGEIVPITGVMPIPLERHEYRDGEIVPITGEIPNHNRITRNLCTVITLGLRGQPYEVFVSNQQLWIPQNHLYIYPDIMVIAGELQLQEGFEDTVMNPLLVIEVLSQSTAGYDHGKKFAAYQTIPSFQEYLLVDQYSQQIEHYVKTGAKKWSFQVYDEADTVVQLATVGLEVPIGDIYDKVKFERSKSASE